MPLKLAFGHAFVLSILGAFIGAFFGFLCAFTDFALAHTWVPGEVLWEAGKRLGFLGGEVGAVAGGLAGLICATRACNEFDELDFSGRGVIGGAAASFFGVGFVVVVQMATGWRFESSWSGWPSSAVVTFTMSMAPVSALMRRIFT